MVDEEKIIRSSEEQKQSEKIYDEYRRELLKRQLSNTENYDKAIFSLSSSGLALSLTAIKFITPLKTASCLLLIEISWILFFCAISSSLIAYVVGNHAITRQLSIAEDYYIKGLVKAQTEKNNAAKCNSILNYANGVFFICAILLTIGFIIINIDGNF